MKHPLVLASLIVIGLSFSSPAAADAPADSASAPARLSIAAPDLSPVAAHRHFLRDRLDASTTGYLTMTFSLSSLSWYEPPTRFDAIAHGAGTAATLGLFLGAVGNTLGMFDEETAWLITGSLAAAGAVYAGARYEAKPLIRIGPARSR